MTYAIVGHRGVGKSALMKRLKSYFPTDIKFVDIDREIEAQHGIIKEIFEQKGEEYFRHIEADVFKAMYRLYGQNPSVFILGAGFPFEQIPKELTVIWVRRNTDIEGRVFLDRPRLLKDVSAFAEYQNKFELRNPGYESCADLVYQLPEGLVDSSQNEKKIFSIFGLQKSFVFNSEKCFCINFSEKKLNSKNEKFILQMNGHIEFSSNCWDLKKLQIWLSSHESFQFKVTDKPTSGNLLSLRDGDFFDWPQDSQAQLLKYFEWVDADIQFYEQAKSCASLSAMKLSISCHEDLIGEAIQKLSLCDRKNYHLKLCPLVENFSDLSKGYLWWKNDPQNRSFLPRSKNGRWNWFRQWMLHQQKMNFVSFLNYEIADQPSLFEALSSPPVVASKFAAVIGSPVRHSYSPQMHHLFFMKNNIPFFAVDVHESEFEEAMPILTQMGLRFASVTSPLKRRVYRWTTEKSVDCHTVQSVNTLSYIESTKAWRGDQTDWPGLKTALANTLKEEYKSVVVWGGGGVLELLKKVWPNANYFPARATVDQIDPSLAPELVVWASPRTLEVQWPPSKWRPKLVYDLNYAESSMGLEYAAKENLNYESGLRFFKEQALEQQKIWSPLL